ncbi:conjugal transfer protein [Maribacter stanieri]|uniref:conjugal transfer protein n=1 Tax=Maribacter stanieri TaxID=440514 RepID=UPI0024953EB5|nr:conjugal transfer protein [Maribacter stanieri]
MKKEIKILVFTILLTLLMSSRATSQGMPVYDNTNFIGLAKSLIESAKQTSELLKTVQFLKEQKENLEKVNNVVRQLKAVRELARNNQILFDVVQIDVRNILNSPYIQPNEVERISDSFNYVIENALESLDFVDQILTNDFLKMTDSERALILKQKELESKKMVSNITVKTKRYRDIISFRKMQDKVNNRQINY